MISRQILDLSQSVPVAKPDSWREGILAAFGSRRPTHQWILSDSVLENYYLMKPHQPLSCGIETFFYRDRLALL